MKPQDIVDTLIRVAVPIIPLIGENAHSAVERAVTVPAEQIRALCAARGMSPKQIDTAIAMWRGWADATSDLVVYIASGGAVQPD